MVIHDLLKQAFRHIIFSSGPVPERVTEHLEICGVNLYWPITDAPSLLGIRSDQSTLLMWQSIPAIPSSQSLDSTDSIAALGPNTLISRWRHDNRVFSLSRSKIKQQR